MAARGGGACDRYACRKCGSEVERMRIERLDIGAFGTIRDLSISFDGPVTLLYGPNEAGKTTVMNFIRAVLFGFGGRGAAADRYTPRQGGGQGGAIVLRDVQDRRIRVERWDSPPGGRGRTPAAGSVRVTFPDGTVGGEAELSSLLGGIAPELFRSLFAFGLSELQELGTLQSDEVSGFLYSAALGASGSELRGAEKKLAQELEQLYRPRGRTPLMNRALQELDAAEKELAESRAQAERYNALEAEAGQLAAEQERLEAQLVGLGQQADWMESCLRARPHWVRGRELKQELVVLPGGLEQFPEDAVSRLEAILVERERLISERDRLELAQAEQQQAMTASASEGEKDVLDRQAQLEELLERRPAYEEAKRLLAEAEAEEEQLGLELERLLRRIGPQWTEEQVDALPSTVMLREQASAFREEWRTWRQEESLLNAEAERLRQERMDSDGPLSGEEAFHTADKEAVREGLERIKSARRLLADWKDAVREIRHAEQRERDWEQFHHSGVDGKSVSGAPLYGMYALTLMIPGALAILQELIAAGVTLVVLLGVSVAWTLARRSTAKGEARQRRPYVGGAAADASAQAAALEAALAAEVRHLRRLAAAGADAETAAALEPADWRSAADPAPAALPQQPEGIEPWLDALEQQLRARQAQLAARVAAGERLQALRAQRERHARAGEPLRQRWHAWLRAHALPEAASPEAALELLQLAEQALQQLQRLHRQAARCEALRRSAEGFAAETAALLGEAAGREPGPALRAWQTARDRELARLQQLEQSRRQLAQLQHQAVLLQQQMDRCEARRLELLEATGTESEEDLRRRYVEYRRRLELLAELRQEELAVRTLVDDGQLDRLNNELERRHAADLEEDLIGLQVNIESVRGQLEHAREEKTRRRYELERLISGGDHADKLQTVEERRAELQRLIKRWAVHAMCSSLFVRTKKMYEHEKQPSVMQRASAYFERITAGRYVRMIAPLGEQRVLAEKENGEQLDTVHLSRGTAEQMYLCIRFALADEYAAAGIRLPLVIDDLFVNFDDERLGYGLELLQSVSQRHQLMLFTCHRHVLEAYESRFPADSVIQLAR
ncbi:MULTISPECIES: AAA family ATPase [unclassified Paenibacillus]|uniref:AAA family ATPase n=1 Tax=unclassified Paenibacillus TaxID=185978 RepID=UPI001AEADDDE|nr:MULTISPECIES: AAA family ATPase [unclassified Paenibacillus]MBP1154810.1 uncharacterized protein YhaN [Paenibacillus sp. PvP091]MBP1169806.1 uncharacterized protein YhaN [Paenibacillus sp. PvR098]MBP2440834.1 uncharacterized protein YhaN [Paenibacillus sp. PvP052]